MMGYEYSGGGIRGEDEYWEWFRECMENRRRPKPGDDDYEPEYEKGRLYLDEHLEEVEQDRGWPMEELNEGDLLEIIYEFLGIDAESARWDPDFYCIEYSHKVA